MTYTFVPTEELDEDYDDGTMPENVADLGEKVVGHRIVNVEKSPSDLEDYWTQGDALVITLDNGHKVRLIGTNDCCAYTELETFIWNTDKIDHVITGVRTADGYSTWSIFADAGDVLELSVGWSSGNPFYYGYGFRIDVIE